MSKVYIGAVFKSNSSGEFKVIARTNDPKYWVVKFLATGYECVAKGNNIPYGKVKDYLHPSVYGVGYHGACIRKPKGSFERRVYDMWANMLKRVYGNYKSRRGGVYHDVEVDPRWWNYLNFREDIKTLEGYDSWVDNPSWCLDKDLLTERAERLYSKHTCKFVPISENTREGALYRWYGQ